MIQTLEQGDEHIGADLGPGQAYSIGMKYRFRMHQSRLFMNIDAFREGGEFLVLDAGTSERERRVFEFARGAFSDGKSLEEAPLHRYDTESFESALHLIGLGLLFGWGMSVTSGNGACRVVVDRDGGVTVAADSAAIRDFVHEMLHGEEGFK